MDFSAGRINHKKTMGSKIAQSESGFPPFVRGPYTGMYVVRPWTIRQYSGFSTAEESNAFYRKNLQAGQKGLSVAFDLATHRGYDSDNPRVRGDVGQAGVAIDSIEDMKILFQDIPLDEISVSMTMNGAVVPIMAFFIALADENGISRNSLRGTIQNDILKEFMVRNTYIYPPQPSMKLVGDIIAFTSDNMPSFNSISVSGYHMHEAGASPEVELAFTIADGLEYVNTALNNGLKIDDFAPRISFFWGIGMSHLAEISKLRAGRALWANFISDLHPQTEKSLLLRAHCQTSGWSLVAKNPFNNLTRTSLEATSAIMGGTQSLHTNSFDEALALPTDYSARLSRNTQLELQNQSDVCQAIDPFGGSHYIENKTNDLISKAYEIIQEIIDLGGMSKYVESGKAKMRIEQDATLKQAHIENGEEKIVGINSYTLGLEEEIEILSIDNSAVLHAQIDKLKRLKANRNESQVEEKLDQLRKDIETGQNVMPSAIEAAKARATLGEISTVLEKNYGRYQAEPRIIHNVYKGEMNGNEYYEDALKATSEFYETNGRRPRILVSKLGQDGHDRGAKLIATGFADIGFDVDIAPLFQTPEEVVKQAIENDVHFIGISSLAGAHTILVPELMQLLKSNGIQDIFVIVGGIIPKDDYKSLYDIGVYKIFGPGTNIAKASIEILKDYSSSKNS